jgi:hypothetical protein
VQLAYSLDGPDGEFTPVTLAGSTVDEGGIEGTVGEPAGTTIEPGQTLEVTYRIALADSVVDDGATALLSIEAYLDQINPASGAGTNLADTAATDVFVSASGEAAAEPSEETDDETTEVAAVDTTNDPAPDAAIEATDATEASTTTVGPTTTVAPAKDDDSGSAVVIIVIVAAAVIVLVVVGVVIAGRRRT